MRDTDESGGVSAQKEYDVYGQVLAKHSKFVDTSLSVEMQEREKRELVFHGCAPETFELAIKVVENPHIARRMTAEDALKVVRFYDKYEFSGGLLLCDDILEEFLAKNYQGKLDQSPRDEDTFDHLVMASAAANDCNLKGATEKSIQFVRDVLSQRDNRKFRVDHVRQLHAHLIRHEATRLAAYMDVTKEEIESPLFPKFFVTWHSNTHAKESIRVIEVKSESSCFLPSTSYVNGTYVPYELTAPYRDWRLQLGYFRVTHFRRRNGQSFNVTLRLKKMESGRGNWVLLAKFPDEDDLVLWECLYSSGQSFPPKQPWVSVDNSTENVQLAVSVTNKTS